MNSDHEILLAPLQSFTDFRFRKAYFKYFSGIDGCYAPYIRLTNDKEIKKSQQLDIQPMHNLHMPVKPQLMVNNAKDFLMVANFVHDLGYDEINWNMGCPYPMVAKRELGAGLLQDADNIKRLLDEIIPQSPIKLGLKMRMGYEDTSDILKIIPHLNDYPLTEVIIHARYAKQLYKKGIDYDRFDECIALSKHPLTYNGDINSVDDFNRVKERFPTVKRWMLGRGVVSDPFLPEMIKEGVSEYPEDRLEVFKMFHDDLFEDYKSYLSGDKQVLMKMTSFWEYFANSFVDSHKTYKRIKKAKNIDKYEEAMLLNFEIEKELRAEE